jgi:hypothetical protein
VGHDAVLYGRNLQTILLKVGKFIPTTLHHVLENITRQYPHKGSSKIISGNECMISPAMWTQRGVWNKLHELRLLIWELLITKQR